MEVKWDVAGRSFVHTCLLLSYNVTSEATAPVRYQVPPFRADLTDLLGSIFFCILPWIPFITSFIDTISTECLMLLSWKPFKLCINDDSYHSKYWVLSRARCQYRSKHIQLSSTEEVFYFMPLLPGLLSFILVQPWYFFTCFIVFCKLSSWRLYTTIRTWLASFKNF